MKKLIKIILWASVVCVVVSVAVSFVSKRKLSQMSDDEIRAFLSSKLGGKVGEDQLASIQDAVIAGVRKGSNAPAVVDDLIEDVDDVVSDVAVDATDAPGDAENADADVS
ncbi:MAG: hypothetical protein BMS9Abin20_1082 [Acidimicrobiia bacterium]|nr:MAG: hypothetical protein BMS9Abin20_1082 [Acidimicrobiia bacterium]